MPRGILLVLAVIAGVAIVLATSAALPTNVATQFGWGGQGGGFMTRAGYQLYYCALLAFMALVVYGSLAWLPSRFPHLVNLPNRDHWLQGERAAHSLAALRSFGFVMALLIVVFLVAIHLLVVEANGRAPPTLNEAVFLGVVGAFLALLAGLIVSMYARFRSLR